MKIAMFLRVLFLYLGITCHATSQKNVQELSSEHFNDFIADNHLTVILFKASEECPCCSKALEYLAKVPQPDLVPKEIQKRFIVDDDIAERYAVLEYPTIVFFRRQQPLYYSDKLQSSDEMMNFAEWLEAGASHDVMQLYDSTFEHLTQAATGATTGDWFVLFYMPGTKEPSRIFPSFDSAALNFKHRMNFAKVDAESNVNLLKRFDVKKTPHIILFKQGKMYRYEPEKYDVQSFSAFIEGWYRNVKVETVPREPTAFDNLTESIALFIKERMDDPERRWIIQTAGVLSIVGLLAVLYLIFCFKGRGSRQTKSD